jgi:hypothetical protein
MIRKCKESFLSRTMSLQEDLHRIKEGFTMPFAYPHPDLAWIFFVIFPDFPEVTKHTAKGFNEGLSEMKGDITL